MVKEIYSFAEYEQFIRSLANNPTFSDPHFQYNEQNLYGSLEKENTRAFVVIDGETVLGIFVWLILPKEIYIELLVGLTCAENAVRQMFQFMELEYPNHQIDFVINPKHTIFRKILKEKGATFGNEQVKLVWTTEVTSTHSSNICLLTPDREQEYRALHIDTGYWTAERILNAKDTFRIFLAMDAGKMIGYLDVTYHHKENEPYSLWVNERYKNQGYERDLLLAAVEMNHPNKMMALIDADAQDELAIYHSAGFQPVLGQNSLYVTYRT